MFRVVGFGCALVAFAVLVPSGALGQDKKKKQKKDDSTPATAQEYAQLAQLKEITGKLVYVDGTQGLTFRLEIPHMEPNPAYKAGKGGGDVYAQMQKLMIQYQQALAIRNPYQRQQRLQSIATQYQRLQMQMSGASGKTGPSPYKIVTENKDFQVELPDDVVVRRMKPPFAYDDRGNPVVYSKEKLEEMRGKDKTKPGLEAKFEDLYPGQVIKLSLRPPLKKPVAKDTDKDKDKDKDAAPVATSGLSRATMIVIMEDVAAAGSLPAEPPKKKNK